MDMLRVDGDRLWNSLMEMARIGATEAGGSRRLALSDEDREGRDLFCDWCREIGLALRIDAMGNIFARRAGFDDELDPVGTGSHLDTQPHGGRFDGVYGVLAGLEVMRTLETRGIRTRAPVELVVWTNEEGARFAPSMIASGVFAGTYELEFALSRRDRDGKSIGEELARIGYAGDTPCGGVSYRAFFEAHIEQGPVLEREELTIGVVTGVQGARWFDIDVSGQDAHAGSTPMPGRRDALAGAAALIAGIEALPAAHGPQSVATVGALEVSPNSRNTVPGGVWLTADLRDREDAVLDAMARSLGELCTAVASERRLEIRIEDVEYIEPLAFAEECIAVVRGAAERLGYPWMEICSGAGHDACHLATVAPTSMIFVPCAGGISHNETESATPEDLAAGCDVLLHAILDRAGLVE